VQISGVAFPSRWIALRSSDHYVEVITIRVGCEMVRMEWDGPDRECGGERAPQLWAGFDVGSYGGDVVLS
jgi:hypothetical protein